MALAKVMSVGDAVLRRITRLEHAPGGFGKLEMRGGAEDGAEMRTLLKPAETRKAISSRG